MATTCKVVDSALVLRNILVETPNVSQASAGIAFFESVLDFCQRSLAVRADTYDVVPAGANELTMADTQDGLRVCQVLFIRGPNGPIYPSSAARLVAVGGPLAFGRYYCPEPNRIVFDTQAPEDIQLNGVVAVAPPAECKVVPAVIAMKHYEAIKAGTLGRLYLQPGKAFTNLALGKQMLGRANAKIAQARFTADQEGTIADPAWRFPKFGL